MALPINIDELCIHNHLSFLVSQKGDEDKELIIKIIYNIHHLLNLSKRYLRVY
jgi:hypothetical protein